MLTATQRPRRTSARRRAQHTSVLQPGPSAPQVLTQPNFIVAQPSPALPRRATQPTRAHVLAGGSISINLSSSAESVEENTTCPICAITVGEEGRGIMCGRCNTWYHPECLYITDEEYISLHNSHVDWHCDHCKSVLTSRLKWGTLEGEERILPELRAAYHEISMWKKNIFMLPRGKAALDFIKELTRIINLFVHKTKWERLALPLLHVFMPIMLQKPSKKSKAKDHARFLSTRLLKWSAGDLKSLMDECRAIQKRLTVSNKIQAESNRKAFCRHMLAGKVKKAMGFINNNNDIKGVHTVTDEIKEILQKKHPKAEPADPSALLEVTASPVQPVIFENINADLIKRLSKMLQGSGGPTLIDSDFWKHMLCCKSYGTQSNCLAEAIANLAKRLCCEHVHPDCLKEYLSSRLVPLDKGSDSQGNPGVRPIGIGEVLRRLVGKSAMYIVKSDIQRAAGSLQMCTGLRSGIEAAVHMTHRAWSDDSTEAILLVDADNAFNRLNSI